ncbi:MAG TPA: cytochrome c [Candidatus Solibacter sp.]|nr:cytochrome c [Candidatus Solibacter sp.]
MTFAAGLYAQNDTERAGAKLFQRHCASCHGTAGGGKKAPSLTIEKVRTASRDQLAEILRNGVVGKGMPSFARLPEQQREQIIAWLRRSQP